MLIIEVGIITLAAPFIALAPSLVALAAVTALSPFARLSAAVRFCFGDGVGVRKAAVESHERFCGRLNACGQDIGPAIDHFGEMRRRGAVVKKQIALRGSVGQ